VNPRHFTEKGIALLYRGALVNYSGRADKNNKEVWLPFEEAHIEPALTTQGSGNSRNR